jgi:hypothetical protein
VSILGNMTISINPTPQNVQAYVVFYWAELDPEVNASSRQFWVQVPYTDEMEIDFLDMGEPYVIYLRRFPNTSLTTSDSEFVLYPYPQSIFGPSLNALEIYGETNLISLKSIELDGKYSTSPKLIRCRCWNIIKMHYVLSL